MKIRTYSELVEFTDLRSRFEYLKLDGTVGKATFGFDRYLNQNFYHSREWQNARRAVILRDNGCDLGLADHPLFSRVYIHHMNPLTPADLVHGDRSIPLDPEFLISTSHPTHNAIHYGDDRLLPKEFVERRPGDHIPWRQSA